MDRKIFKIQDRNKDCVLLIKSMPNTSPHQVMWQVRDIENDIIYMGYDFNKAREVFDSYDISKVRKERKKAFEDWLYEFAEA